MALYLSNNAVPEASHVSKNIYIKERLTVLMMSL
jgi:hypothetical protein